MMNLKHYIVILLLIYYIFAHKEDKNYDKKLKVSSCFSLARQKFDEDKGTFESFLNKFPKDKKLSDKSMNSLFNILLINCYRNINQEQIQKIINANKEHKKIYIDSDMQNVLGLGPNFKKSDLDPKTMQSTMTEVNQILKELKQDEDKLKKEMGEENYYKTFGKYQTNPKNKKKQKQKKNKPKKEDKRLVYKNEKWENIVYPNQSNILTKDDFLNPLNLIRKFGFDTISGVIIILLVVMNVTKKVKVYTIKEEIKVDKVD